MPANKVTNSAETSDWVCTNCGATLLGVNNSELSVGRDKPTYKCPCGGNFIGTRNEPTYNVKLQRKNIGGGKSWPGG